MGEKEFIDSIAWLAQEDSRKSGILASITIAQACLESGYGTSKLATFANNIFGMKCILSGNTWESVWDGKSKYQKVTMEQKPSGETYYMRCDFRKYPDTESCIKDHSAYLLNAMNGAQRRFGMVGAKDYRLVASEIQKGGYATDVRYADKICEIIEKWNLTKYDGGKTVKICLDAGHYGKYNRSPVDDRYYESDMVWNLHLLQKKYLEEYGGEVVLTRGSQGTNMGLYERGVLSFGCDLFISNHSNAAGNEPIDYPVAYCAIDGSADGIGMALAQCVERVMGTNQKARIEHRQGSHGDYYGVIRGATAVGTPGLILEHSFHTNQAATQWLLNDGNLDKLARAEVETIAQYYGLKKEKKSGWVHEDGGERFYLGDSEKYVANDWYQDDGKWYWFDGAGHMVTDTWYQYRGDWYYLGQDGAMVKGLQSVDGKWYYLDQGGKMSKEPVLLTPGEDGALRYPEMATE
jgi:N-acetylmuramoyl-L-alanine amidase